MRMLKPGRPCRVQGCPKKTRDRGIYCNAHDLRNRRWGHPLGHAMNRKLISDARKLITTTLNRQSNSAQVWEAARSMWRQTVQWAEVELRDHKARNCGRVEAWGSMYADILAADQTRAGGDRPWLELAAIVFASYRYPMHVNSDRHTRFLVAHAMRRMSRRHHVRYTDMGRTWAKTVIRPLGPRFMDAMGQALMERCGHVGLQVFTVLSRAEQAAEAKRRQALTTMSTMTL